jgi:hypothetical protein
MLTLAHPATTLALRPFVELRAQDERRGKYASKYNPLTLSPELDEGSKGGRIPAVRLAHS